MEEEPGENLVGNRISEEINGGDSARNERPGENGRGEKSRRRRGLLHVALREVVNPRINDGDLDGGASTGSPDFGVEAAEIARRRRWVRLRWHLAKSQSYIFFLILGIWKKDLKQQK